MEEIKDSTETTEAPSEPKLESEPEPLTTPTEVSVYDILPQELTTGTAYDYFVKLGGGLEEEIYYLLQVAHRKDAVTSEIVEACKRIVDERNELLLSSFRGTDPAKFFECNVSLDNELCYEPTGLFEQLLCNPEIER